ncbi:TetR/AcrR family transcriptional regulator [Smaragdicoccus niigatensis]|uniref:TetR/AcrR family transcriptional regulator n=1 Tax=Smaragdicoccus niigatensis TaxID=359359 RepID=UPI00036F4A11|nr:helix-turn-helix domain-containing protein [Smaragdicoccus niigatensis]
MGRAEVVRDYGGVSADDRRAERRRKLLDAGRRIWGESGISEVTVRGVCTASGLTPRYFYEQFDNREALLVAITDEVLSELTAVLLTVGLGEPGGVEHKLRAAFKAFLDVVEGDPHLHRIVDSDVAGVPGLLERRGRFLDSILELVLEHGPRLLDLGEPDPALLRRGATFIVGGVNQVIESWLHEPDGATTAEVAASCAAMCLAVVRTDIRDEFGRDRQSRA